MPTLAAVIAAFKSLTDLGASPAVQQAFTQEMAVLMGVPQAVLNAALQAAKDAPTPKS
jgi:hypothetical protein